jgi:hypothetical protein
MQHETHDDIQLSAALLAAAGLTFDAADLAGVRALRTRFAADRQRLMSINLRDAEPLTVVAPPRVEGA